MATREKSFQMTQPKSSQAEPLGIEVKGAYIMSAIQTLAEFRRLGESALAALGVTSLEPQTFYPAELRRAIHSAIYDRFGTPGIFWVGLETPGFFYAPEERPNSPMAVLTKPTAEWVSRAHLSELSAALSAYVQSLADSLNGTIRDSTRGRDFNAGWYVTALESEEGCCFELINNSTSTKDHEGFPRAIFHWSLRHYTPENFDFNLLYRPDRSIEYEGHSSLVYDLEFKPMGAGKSHVSLFSQERSEAREALFSRALEHAMYQEDRANAALSDLAKSHQQTLESIRYASVLQRQQLPKPYRWQHRLGGLGIVWEPRDLVGGDMWWVDGLVGATNRIRLCLFDCTGHGVPGAMLSLVFTNALEREFSDGNDKHAFAAVNAMQSAIAQSFGESDEAVDIDHGCDLVFLDIDRDQKQIEVVFAGLGLIHWHAVELRAQAFASPRGGISAAADCLRGIQRNVISYRPGDRLLLATDGVTDQLCQQTPTRGFGYRWLQEVFAANAQLPLDQCIAAIRDRLQGWQGAQVRRDDVTIIALDLN